MNRSRPLDMRQLQVFEKLCCTNSFTQTAKHLYVTQSAVSHSLKNLEEDVGCKLIEKTGKKFSLTHAGDRLLKFARPLLEEMDKVKEEIAGGKTAGAQKLRVGASDKICRFLLPDILTKISGSEGISKFEVHGIDTLNCLNMLSAGKIDLALTVEPIQRNEYSFIPCFSDEIVVVLHPKHPWVMNRKIPWEKADQEKFIVPNRTSYTFRDVEKFLKEHRFSFFSYVELNCLDTMKEMILRQMGIGIMPDWSVTEEVESEKLVTLPFGIKRLIRHWGVSFLREKELVETEKNFIRCVENLGCKWMLNRKTSNIPLYFG